MPISLTNLLTRFPETGGTWREVRDADGLDVQIVGADKHAGDAGDGRRGAHSPAPTDIALIEQRTQVALRKPFMRQSVNAPATTMSSTACSVALSGSTRSHPCVPRLTTALRMVLRSSCGVRRCIHSST